MKIMTIVGTRPEVIRLSRIIPKLDLYFDHILVHTGQNFNYKLNEIFFDQLRIRSPDLYLNAAGISSSETIGKIIINIDKVLVSHKPDAILILGDTNSCLSAAIAAKKRMIPIFHMEAGNRCFDARVPEEINRRIVDHISDVNMTYSAIAREYLLFEGFTKDRIIKVGSPLTEVIQFYKNDIYASKVLESLNLTGGQYFLASFHREENVDNVDKLIKIINSLNLISEKYNKRVIVSLHPRTEKKLGELSFIPNKLVTLHEPFGYFDYVKLQLNAICVLSDSGTITEESSILNFPALNIRESHERPEGFEEGAVMMAGLNSNELITMLDIASNQARGRDREIQIVSDYTSTNISDKVIRILLSYVDYINREVWKIIK